MRASGAESLNVAASIFMGQTEAPLTIRPFIPRMTESELMTIMTAGMAHISGGIMAAYILFGVKAEHLLTAVIMTAPGTLMMAKIFVPETQVPETMGTVKLEIERTDVNVIDAAGRGTGEGLALALNVGAMLISFLALVALVNALLGPGASQLEQIFGWVFAPIAWAMGVPWQDAGIVATCSARAWRSTSSSPTRSWVRWRARSIRSRSPSRPSRCAASPTSARSASRSAASARSPRRAATTWRASACARCSRERSPIS
jgi:nucleoside permease NupC